MSIDFGYAQARAQARHGGRLSVAEWRLIESANKLAQYLHAARGTSLAERVEHFSANSSPHAIERSLRRDWRSEVENTAHWVPVAWRDAVAWTRWLPDLPAIADLIDGGTVLPWMHDDPLLHEFALTDREQRHRAIMDALGMSLDQQSEGLDEWWTARWQAQWPPPLSAHAGLREVVGLLRGYRTAMRDVTLPAKAAKELGERLRRRVVRLLRSRMREPVVIFCHLLLTAFELQRLRNGLIRRALFNDIQPEVVA